MFSAKEKKSELFDRLGAAFEPQGFKKLKTDSAFVRAFEFGRQAIFVKHVNHPDDFDVICSVAVRFDALEDLVNQDNLALTPTERKKTYSFGAELGNIAGSGQMRWNVNVETDLRSTSDAISAVYGAVGSRYIDEMSDMHVALDRIRTNDRSSRLHSPFPLERAKRTVGIAALLGLPDLQTFIAEQRAAIVALGEGSEAKFDAFCQRVLSSS